VLDVDLPEGGAPSTALRGIAAVSSTTAIIVVSREDCDLRVLDLLRAGAMSCCHKASTRIASATPSSER
jgi:DNA-binding NarL/FixJ family response regulator